jgi:hypothetical protein
MKNFEEFFQLWSTLGHSRGGPELWQLWAKKKFADGGFPVSWHPDALDSALKSLQDTHPADYTIQVAFDILVQFLSGFAIVSYERYGCPTQFTLPLAAIDPVINFGGIIASNKTLLNLLTLKPWPPSPPPQTSDSTFKFLLSGVNATVWALNIDPYAVRIQTP